MIATHISPLENTAEDAPQEKGSALSGKLGMIPGVSSKCLYAPDTQKAPK